jgi:hypothetical protein
MLKDGRQVKLGRIRPKVRPQALRFSAYYDAAKDTTPPPASVDYSVKSMAAIKQMYLNDQYGDCVIASAYHQEGIWSGNETGTPVLGTDAEVYAAYQTICGPGDNGCDISAVLNYTRDNGLKFNGVTKKIAGYVAIDWTNKTEVQVAIDLFGSLKLGINLPGDWTCTNCTWDITNSSIVGGHDVPCVGYTETGVQICTWAGIVTITWAAFANTTWIEECYCVLSPDWTSNANLSPNGIDVATLTADLAKLGAGTIPPLGPGPVNPPPTCPAGQHLDPVTNQCVPDVGPPPPPPPPPPGPITSTGTLTIPALAVPGLLGHVSYTTPTTVQVTVQSGASHGDSLNTIVIPPWLMSLFRIFCSGIIPIPPQWAPIVAIVCGFLPPPTPVPVPVPVGASPCAGCK